MAKHRRFTSHDGATESGAGDAQKTRGHPQHGLWVEADGIDPESDTLAVRIEGSPEDVHYAPIDSGAPEVDDVLFIDESDLVQSDADGDVYVAYVAQHNHPIEYVRANIVDHSGGFDVTTHVYIGGWSGSGKSYAEREDVPDHALGR